jgi:deoxyribodipyrimidine photo-lyase
MTAVEDNRALSRASALAQKQNVPLVVVTAINPGDYKAHDRSHRRIDFYLRNLVSLKAQLEKLHIPLLVLQNDGPRKALPSKILDLVTTRPLEVANVFANLSYEVDELQRNIALLEQGKEKGVTVEFLHDRLVVPPGGIERKSKDGGVYTVRFPSASL